MLVANSEQNTDGLLMWTAYMLRTYVEGVHLEAYKVNKLLLDV